MAGDEDQAQRSSPTSSSSAASRSARGRPCWSLELAAELLVLALERLLAAQRVDRAVLGGGHEPGARVVRDARFRPLLERGDERVLGESSARPTSRTHPREAGDEPGRLDPPDRVDRAMGVGSRHGYRLERNFQSPNASRVEQLNAFRLLGKGSARLSAHCRSSMADLGLTLPARPYASLWKVHEAGGPFDHPPASTSRQKSHSPPTTSLASVKGPYPSRSTYL